MKKQIKKLIVIFCLLVFIFLLSFAFRFSGAYNNLSWLDILMHFAGGAMICYFFINLLRFFEKKIIIKNRFIEIIILISITSLIAVFFEFYEFLIDFYLKPIETFQGDLTDTLSDLFFGIFGGFLTTLFRKV